ncbi:MAG: hypothetical protein CMD88_02560 [Gammaproteobacteria bacterium]|nr:hypothetical protein [Gammaproteobacteria bacterium]|tara:strand:+ start:2538 stop:3041 length:504 start_codon:yes stop_codon:yes gene_type:complete
MKKFFKKYMPDKGVVKEYGVLKYIGQPLLHKELWEFNRKSFCSATAIGLFWGWMPMPFQMIPAALCSIWFRANFALSLLGVWVSNPITMPPMMYFAYVFGNIILGTSPEYKEFTLSTEWISDSFSNIWEPLIVGCLIIGIFTSVLGYIVMHIIWKIYLYNQLQKRKK